MAEKAKRHVHKYARVELSGTQVWACALPDCYHYMPKHMEKMVLGKASRCWGTDCDEILIMNPTNMKMQKPICDDCQLGLTPSWDNLPISSTEEKPKKSITEMSNDEIAAFMKR